MLDDVLHPQSVLERFTRDLTAEARAGLLEPVRCRDGEIERLIDILLRQSKNNPVLVGPAGVGKTAIVEGLAQHVAAGRVPLALRNARVLSLDHMGLLAGTMYRGQYEERMRALVEHVSRDAAAILFVDELHNLMGQGTAVGVAMDAANMLKPALVRGAFRMIGATTDAEYARWIRADAALERRFQRLVVRELSAEQTAEILEARREGLERHHNVVISADALAAAVRVTDAFITDRARPDRAIDALDEACAHLQARAVMTAETEALVLRRRALLRAIASGKDDADAEVQEQPEADPFQRMARDGFAVLERLGAGLEAALSGRTATRPTTSTAAEGAPAGAASPEPVDASLADVRVAAEPARAAISPRAALAALEVELRERLVAEGIVVRGHDVARVVGVATERSIQWVEGGDTTAAPHSERWSTGDEEGGAASLTELDARRGTPRRAEGE
ncbi:MAG TPA: AAA family ATPase [Gemmatimonadaceae bacterium]|nr:AAA family ATPase [Gemmatimonadaceae bacterium]